MSNGCYLTLMLAFQSYISSFRWKEGTDKKKSGGQPGNPSMHSSVLGQGQHFSYLTSKFLEEHSQASAAEKTKCSCYTWWSVSTKPILDYNANIHIQDHGSSWMQQKNNILISFRLVKWSRCVYIFAEMALGMFLIGNTFQKISWSDLNRRLGSHLETRWLFQIWLVVAVQSLEGICGFSLLYLWNLWTGVLIFPLLAYKILLLADKPKRNGVLLQLSTVIQLWFQNDSHSDHIQK